MSESCTNPGSYRIRIAPTADGGDRIPDLSPREVREYWLDKLRVSMAESTVSAYHYRLKHFIEWCEAEGLDSIRDITGWDLKSYEAYRRAEGLEVVTLNNELGTLENFFEYCARSDLVDESLPEKVEPPTVPPEADVDETKLDEEDAKRLFTYYQNDPRERHSRAHALLTLTWFGGPPRNGAIRGLDLRDYHSDEQYLEYHHRPSEETPLKNNYKGERAVALPAEACAVLDAYIEENRVEIRDDYGRRPLFTGQRGRPSLGGIRGWMYLATVPCLHSDCPHGNDRETCEFLTYSTASKCPSSRSPHQVRTGAITWMRNQEIPADVVAERADTSVSMIEKHYDKPEYVEEMEKRRRPYLDRLDFDEGGEDQ
ncbi:tyrosine-type recombinase/integrase [Salinirubellus sp. GCM10025818]|uniref:tyrosine-type recombinase/integrase n=2 Tax=Natronomonadaceae TaxID=3402413 RepID=UPI0030CB89DB